MANLWNWNLNRYETLLAVSGGADSVVMARFFKALNYPFAIAHVNYGLRGNSSDADQQLVEDLARELDVDCYLHRANTQEFARSQGISVQMSARQIRYSFFNEIRQRYPNRFGKIATAHHGTDNLEHFFLYVQRGNFPVAWRGIPAENGDIIRPMLGYSKEEIYEIARAHGWIWREDESNQKPVYLRNKIRHWIMPMLSDFSDNGDAAVAENTVDFVADFYRLSMQNQRLNAKRFPLFEHQWDRWVETSDQSIWIPDWHLLFPAGSFQEDFRTFAIGKIMSWGFSKDQAKKIMEFKVAVGGKLIGSSMCAWRARSGWMLLKKLPAFPHGSLEKCLQLREDCCGDFAILDSGLNMKRIFVSTAIEGMVLKVGPWERGNYFLRKSGKKKLLSDVFTEMKIEQYRKESFPVVSNEFGEVIAVFGLKISDLYKVSSNDTHCFRLDFIQN